MLPWHPSDIEVDSSLNACVGQEDCDAGVAQNRARSGADPFPIFPVAADVIATVTVPPRVGLAVLPEFVTVTVFTLFD